jgi:hypothetical protein
MGRELRYINGFVDLLANSGHGRHSRAEGSAFVLATTDV